MLKLRKVELVGFKSFCEKTPIKFSGSGITCIVGPNGCGKSNVVDAISWVLGEQSHKMLRAERMADCIFNGTAKRPPMGFAEVTLTLVDPELSEAVAKVMGAAEADASSSDAHVTDSAAQPGNEFHDPAPEALPTGSEIAAAAAGVAGETKAAGRKHAPKAAVSMRPGEVVIGRRLYRSGQSEYLINGRVARLRDVQEIFMGIGLGPDSYAIIEQGRIGQILNSRPGDRRAIIEEAAGVTMYKTKRRLAEAKLEAAKVNLSRVNDILAEVEKQSASLKRQAGKARRYAELREQMRGLLRAVLASKAAHLDIEAARILKLLRELEEAEGRAGAAVRELETDQERLAARTYELDENLRQTQNQLGQAALELDRSENRITFNREQAAQMTSRAGQIEMETRDAEAIASALESRLRAERDAVRALRQQTAALEAEVRQAAEQVTSGAAEQRTLEAQLEELRQRGGRLLEEAAREQAKAAQSEEAAVRGAAAEEQRSEAIRGAEAEHSTLASQADAAEHEFAETERRVQLAEEASRLAALRLTEMRKKREAASHEFDLVRQELSAARARHGSIDAILRERSYTADTVQKLFQASANGNAGASKFRTTGLLADCAEVNEKYEGAVEQFLRQELEYLVVETFDDARTGVAILRDELGGRATFFVDSLAKALYVHDEDEDRERSAAERGKREGILARLDELIEFRDPLGAAAKKFLTRLHSAYLVESAEIAERLARSEPGAYFVTPDGTCYHGRVVSGGRAEECGPLALKRELRRVEGEIARLEQAAGAQETELARLAEGISTGEREAGRAAAALVTLEKALIEAGHRREQARTDLRRADQQLEGAREEISRLREETRAARASGEGSRRKQEAAIQARSESEAEAEKTTARLAQERFREQALQEQVSARRAELAALGQRLAGAETAEQQLAAELARAADRLQSLRAQQESLLSERAALEASCGELGRRAQELRAEKARLEERREALDSEWQQSRGRAAAMDEQLRASRQGLEELRTQRSERQIEQARNDADREYLRQTTAAELNTLPEQLIAEHQQLLAGEALIAAETSYNEMKARVEAMGPVNMMALEEFQECEQREGFLRRERDDLVASIQNTQLTINELDQVSRQKFEEAFTAVNRNFAVAFETLFGGGHGEMRLGEPDSSGESGIDIVAQPPGKRLQNILLLSGGEKALTALALLIAIFRYRPSPFCILDEVDAPLDEANVGRFNRMLADMCAQTQFIVVTHNRRTMEMGSVLYGVTMQEPGVSRLVSVKWEEAEAKAESQAASNAA